MADDVLEDAGPAPDAGKVKREPPTIDLEATKEVLRIHGGLWFWDESYVISRKRGLG